MSDVFDRLTARALDPGPRLVPRRLEPFEASPPGASPPGASRGGVPVVDHEQAPDLRAVAAAPRTPRPAGGARQPTVLPRPADPVPSERTAPDSAAPVPVSMPSLPVEKPKLAERVGDADGRAPAEPAAPAASTAPRPGAGRSMTAHPASPGPPGPSVAVDPPPPERLPPADPPAPPAIEASELPPVEPTRPVGTPRDPGLAAPAAGREPDPRPDQPDEPITDASLRPLPPQTLLVEHLVPILRERGILTAREGDRAVAVPARRPAAPRRDGRVAVALEGVEIPQPADVHLHVERIEVIRPEGLGPAPRPTTTPTASHGEYLTRQRERWRS